MHSIGVIGIGDVLDHVMIRGRLLKLDELFACDITSSELIASHREAFESGKPFEHIVLDGLFNPQLLNIVGMYCPISNTLRRTRKPGLDFRVQVMEKTKRY